MDAHYELFCACCGKSMEWIGDSVSGLAIFTGILEAISDAHPNMVLFEIDEEDHVREVLEQ